MHFFQPTGTDYPENMKTDWLFGHDWQPDVISLIMSLYYKQKWMNKLTLWCVVGEENGKQSSCLRDN